MSLIKKIGFLTAFIIPLLAILGFYLGGYWNYMAIVFVFLLIPIADWLIGQDPENMTDQEALIVSEQLYYRLITYIWTFFQFGFLIWGAYAIADSAMEPVALYGFVLSFSLVTGGIGITVAHELGHKKTKLERFYARVILMTVCYMHFYIEHNRGHHVYVATPRDPATSRKGESFYVFWFRSVIGSYFSAWKLERSRLQRKGLSFWGMNNEMIWYTILPILFAVILTFGTSVYFERIVWEVPLFFFAQSLVAFTLLEIVNYVEHYGIVRKEKSPGVYESVNPMHSWNSNHRLSNFFLFQLQRHSDHHANAIKRYQVLKHYEESPQLPSGYPAMILLAAIPPLWFLWMNPKLKNWERAVYNRTN